MQHTYGCVLFLLARYPAIEDPQYELLVDKYARQPRRRPDFQLQTFYGQLQNIFVIHFNMPCEDLGLLNHSTTIILAAIRTCNLSDADPQLQGLDIRYYSTNGALHMVDITSVQCLVGHVRDRNQWVIVDRSRTLARVLYIGDNDPTTP
jgi:hypothetical protein